MRAILDLQAGPVSPSCKAEGTRIDLVPCLAILGLQRYDGSNVTSALTADNVEICSFNTFAYSRCRLVRKSLQMSAMGRTTRFGREGGKVVESRIAPIWLGHPSRWTAIRRCGGRSASKDDRMTVTTGNPICCGQAFSAGWPPTSLAQHRRTVRFGSRH